MKRKKYGLSDNAEKEIKKLLREYDPEKVKAFIYVIKYECELSNSFHETEMAERPKEVIKILNNLRTTIGNLEYMKKEFGFLGSVPDDEELYKNYCNGFSYCRSCIDNALPEIVKLVNALETMLATRRKPRGHPGADFNWRVTGILMDYERLIDKAHPYKGPFPKIIDAFFEDARGKSHTREIRRAFKNLNRLRLNAEANSSNDISEKKFH